MHAPRLSRAHPPLPSRVAATFLEPGGLSPRLVRRRPVFSEPPLLSRAAATFLEPGGVNPGWSDAAPFFRNPCPQPRRGDISRTKRREPDGMHLAPHRLTPKARRWARRFPAAPIHPGAEAATHFLAPRYKKRQKARGSRRKLLPSFWHPDTWPALSVTAFSTRHLPFAFCLLPSSISPSPFQNPKSKIPNLQWGG